MVPPPSFFLLTGRIRVGQTPGAALSHPAPLLTCASGSSEGWAEVGATSPVADAAEKDLFDLSFRTRDRRLLSAARVEDEQGLIFQPLFPAQVVCQSCSGDDGRDQQPPPVDGFGSEMEGEQTCPHAQRHSESPGQLDVYIRTPRGDVFTYSTETPDDPSPVPFRDILRPVTYEVDLVSSDGATGRGGDARRHRVSLKILEPAGGFESWLVNSWSMAGGGLYAFQQEA